MKVYVLIKEEWERSCDYNNLYTTIKGIFTNKDEADKAVEKLRSVDAYQKEDDHSDMGIDYYVDDYETDIII